MKVIRILLPILTSLVFIFIVRLFTEVEGNLMNKIGMTVTLILPMIMIFMAPSILKKVSKK